VSDASGEQIFQTTGPATPGLHMINWTFSATRAPAAPEPREQTPAERRDSILLNVRAPRVLDSLQRAGFDSAAIASVRNAVAQATGGGRGAAPGGGGGAAPGGGGGGAAPGGGGGAAGAFAGRGAAPGVISANCDHPLTQWDTFCPRPMEVTGGRGGGAGGAGGGRGGAADPGLEPVRRIWGIIGMNPPGGAAGGRGGGGGGRGGFGGGAVAEPGTYLVTLTVNGQTLRQTFRVERTIVGSVVLDGLMR
jgi:hypothetical protein